LQSLSLKSTVAAHPRAALQVPVISREIRAAGTGSVLSPRPLRVAVGPKRQARSGKLRLAAFVDANCSARSERRRQRSFELTASVGLRALRETEPWAKVRAPNWANFHVREI
jgi:hypothetical protein